MWCQKERRGTKGTTSSLYACKVRQDVPTVKEFLNIYAIILDINEAGMYKLGAKKGEFKGVYSRNQFEVMAV